MSTVHANAEIEIERPAADVWGLISDYESDTRWRKGIREMTPDVPGQPQVGTQVREVLHLAGRDYVTETTVTEVGPGFSYRFAGSGDSGQVRGRRSVREGAAAGLGRVRLRRRARARFGAGRCPARPAALAAPQPAPRSAQAAEARRGRLALAGDHVLEVLRLRRDDARGDRRLVAAPSSAGPLGARGW